MKIGQIYKVECIDTPRWDRFFPKKQDVKGYWKLLDIEETGSLYMEQGNIRYVFFEGLIKLISPCKLNKEL